MLELLYSQLVRKPAGDKIPRIKWRRGMLYFSFFRTQLFMSDKAGRPPGVSFFSMKRPPLPLNRARVSLWCAAAFRIPQIPLYLANSRSTLLIKSYHRRTGWKIDLKNEPQKTCYLPFAPNNFWVSPPHRRFVGKSITWREKASGLSWLEIDQVIQIPPRREAKRIGFKTG